MVRSQRDFGVTLLGPLREGNSPQSQTHNGYDRGAFTIDWGHQRVTCPQGMTNTIWSECHERGRESIVVRFSVTACQPCPIRPQYTQSTRNGHQLMLRPRHIHDTVEQARAEQATDEWKQRYATRAGVERTIHQAIAVTGSVAAAISDYPRHDWRTSSPPPRPT
jgi:hypothetical protein